MRELSGWTVSEFARRVGVTPQEIGHLEMGRRKLTVAWLQRLSAVLNCAPWDIIETPAVPDLSAEEAELVAAFRRLSKEAKRTLLAELKGW